MHEEDTIALWPSYVLLVGEMSIIAALIAFFFACREAERHDRKPPILCQKTSSRPTSDTREDSPTDVTAGLLPLQDSWPPQTPERKTRSSTALCGIFHRRW